jgi:hypothetical protein
MMHVNTTPQKTVSSIGQEIGLELGLKFVSDYQKANPTETHSYVVGKGIIEKILAQPNCEGIRFHMATNEMGETTMVYTGLDSKGQPILNYSIVNNEGILCNEAGIVADRITRGGGRVEGGAFDNDNWNFETE